MSLFGGALVKRAEALVVKCRERGIKIAVAESCTGGLVASLITSIAGSSDVFDRGFITYSNEAKRDMLGVKLAILKEHGAVSAACAHAMAAGALRNSHASLAVSVTGIAGPGGGTASKPVGLVYFACHGPLGDHAADMKFGDIGREAVRLASVEVALGLLATQAE
jgi:nicotinamide-nucleotide amidase